MAGHASRDRCGVRTRDGSECQAPVHVPEGLRCRRHGGATRQAIMAARRRELAITVLRAEAEWQAARGTNRERPQLYRWCDAVNELERYDADLTVIRRMRAAVRQPGIDPALRRDLLVWADARLGRIPWWPSGAEADARLTGR